MERLNNDPNRQLHSTDELRQWMQATADAAMDAVAVAPIAVSIDPVERMRRDAAAFRGAASLPQFVEPQSNADPAEHVPLYGRLLGQFLRR